MKKDEIEKVFKDLKDYKTIKVTFKTDHKPVKIHIEKIILNDITEFLISIPDNLTIPYEVIKSINPLD